MCYTLLVGYNIGWDVRMRRILIIALLTMIVNSVFTFAADASEDANIPKNKFKAVYFDRTKPDKKFTSIVDDIAVNYSWRDLHNIPSENFAAYWIGDFEFSERTIREIAISQGWSGAKIFVNDKLIYNGGNEGTFTHEFEAGTNRIEVQYINNWHTTEFLLKIRKPVQYALEADVLDIMAEISTPKSIYWVGLYESSRKDMVTELNITTFDNNQILFLDSYSAIKWKIGEVDWSKIPLVVVSSYLPGSQILGNVPLGTHVAYMKNYYGIYAEDMDCSCHSGYFHCESDNDNSILWQNEHFLKHAGTAIGGYSFDYDASVLTVPQKRLDSIQQAKLTAYYRSVENDRKKCSRKASIDDVFSGRSVGR